MPMAWSDADNVGVPEFDLQHQRIFNVRILLAANPEATTGSEVIADALDQLMRYGDAHFRAEEDLLRTERYPHLDEQIEGHRQFRRAIAELCFATSAGAEDVPALLRTFLDTWWDDHIRGADRRYAAFLRERSCT